MCGYKMFKKAVIQRKNFFTGSFSALSLSYTFTNNQIWKHGREPADLAWRLTIYSYTKHKPDQT